MPNVIDIAYPRMVAIQDRTQDFEKILRDNHISYYIVTDMWAERNLPPGSIAPGIMTTAWIDPRSVPSIAFLQYVPNAAIEHPKRLRSEARRQGDNPDEIYGIGIHINIRSIDHPSTDPYWTCGCGYEEPRHPDEQPDGLPPYRRTPCPACGRRLVMTSDML